MGTEWLNNLALDFKDCLENRDFVDVKIYCQDGQVCCHRLVLSFASTFMKNLMTEGEKDDLLEISLIIPDISAFDLSDFLMALYGGPLPNETSTFEQIVELLGISTFDKDAPSFDLNSNKKEVESKRLTDLGEVFGQICSEIAQEFLPSVSTSQVLARTPDPVPRYYTKQLPANAQLLQLPRPSPATNSCPEAHSSLVQDENDLIQMPQNVGECVEEQFMEDDGGYQSFQQGAGTWPVQTSEPQLIEVVENQVIIQDINPIDQEASGFSAKFFWTCNMCGERVPTQQVLKEHMRSAHQVGDPVTFSCAFCSMKFSSKLAKKNHELIKHQETHPPVVKESASSSVKPAKRKLDSSQSCEEGTTMECVCEDCGENFSTKQKLNLHVRVVHEGERPFSCDKCSKKFAAEFLLTEHQLLAHKDEASPIENSDSKSLKTSELPMVKTSVIKAQDLIASSLPQVPEVKGGTNGTSGGHSVYKELDSKICSECGKVCEDILRLNFHIRVRHSGEIPKFVCTFCPKKFFQNNNLKRHLNEKHGIDNEGLPEKKSKLDFADQMAGQIA